MKFFPKLFAASLLASSSLAYGQATLTWDQPNANNAWNTIDANWTGGATFATNDNVIFNAATGETVTVDAGGVSVGTMAVGANNGSWVFSGGSITSSGALTKDGTGTLSLSSANSFASVSLNGGALTISNIGAFGSGTLTVGTGATGSATEPGSGTPGNFLFLSGITSGTFGNNISLPADATSRYRKIVVQGGGAGSYNFSGVISGGGAGTTLYFDSATGGDATSIFRLSNTNTFVGKVEFNRGSMQIDSDAALGGSSNALVLDGFATSRLIFNYSGNYTHATTIATATSFDTGSNNITATGIISGGARLTKVGTGSLTLNNGSNSYATTTLSAGTLSLGAASAMGTGQLTHAGGTLQTTALTSNVTIANAIALSGTGDRILLMYGTGNGNNTVEYSGQITGSATRLYLNNNQSGSTNPQFIFSNATNTFTANININRGGMRIASNEALGNLANTVTFDSNPGADLTFLNAMTYTRATTLSTGTDFDTGANAVTASGVISGGGVLTKIGSGSLTLSNSNTYTGATTLTNGTLSVATIGNGATAGNLGSATAAAANIVFDGGTLQYTGASATSDRAFTINAGKTAKIDTANNISFAGATGTATNGALTKTGAGTLTLTGSNTYTGATTVNGGKLSLGGTGSLSDSTAVNVSATSIFDISGIAGPSETIGSLISSPTSAITLGSHTLDVGIDNTSFLSEGDISGAGGSITKSGVGIMTLGGNNTYTGSTNLFQGTLLLGSGTALPSSAAFVLSGATTFRTGGFTTATGPLTLSATGGEANIDLGSGTSIVTFDNTNLSTWSGMLNVWNYSGGAIWTPGTVDKLIFTNNSGSFDLANVQFYTGNVGDTGSKVGTGAGFINNELVPIPEPSSLYIGVIMFGLIGSRKRRIQ